MIVNLCYSAKNAHYSMNCSSKSSYVTYKANLITECINAVLQNITNQLPELRRAGDGQFSRWLKILAQKFQPIFSSLDIKTLIASIQIKMSQRI